MQRQPGQPPGPTRAPLGHRSSRLLPSIPAHARFLVPSHTCNLKVREPHGLLPGGPPPPLSPVAISAEASLASPHCSLAFQRPAHRHPYQGECRLSSLFHKTLGGYLLSARHSSKALGG
ncbi:unnamed protein product [Rangifer tarandus platyrhynchus]|uniref:Uncharacterized protein n=1 Tax=Rangifer tarandus platyrhynchus TaxID=3082113 RepID=A0AC59YAD7_RANTA